MTVTVTHKGWFMFCPVWYCEDLHLPFPRHVPGFVLDSAIFVQERMNDVLEAIGHAEAVGYGIVLKDIESFIMEIPDFEND